MEKSRAALRKQMLSAPVIKKANLSGKIPTANAASSPSTGKHARNGQPKLKNVSVNPNTVASKYSSSDMPVGLKLHNIITALREKDAPADDNEIFRLTAINVSLDATLREELQNNEKVKYDAQNNTYQYKPQYNIRSNDDLLELLKASKVEGGMDFKELSESWSGLAAAVQELEKNGEILVLRTKDNRPRTLFWNDSTLNIKMSEDFQKYWHEVKVPLEGDLAKELERVGLKSMETFSTVAKEVDVKPAAKRRVNKRIKLTNTHLLDGLDLLGM
ncbi:hypothetical protein BC832DRAFT_272744 [Gaertneriomyces semiglobifer]|nr:hypothetical protein BC832DRAFT_272744 [Gaertneriomyces semiglobifer]